MPTEGEIEAAGSAISELLDQDMPVMFRGQVTVEQITKYAIAGLGGCRKDARREMLNGRT